MNKITKEDIRVFEHLYFNEFYTLKSIGEKYGVSVNTVKKYLKDHPDYKVRAKLNYSNMGLNHSYFKIIDTEAKAYLLGFLITDGNVYKDTSYRIRLQLHCDDVAILELLKKEVNTNNKILHIDRGMVHLCFTSESMYTDLAQYGVVPNKTHKSYLPILPDDMMQHLIRGIIDGDGFTSCFYRKGSKNKAYNIGVCGTESLVKGVRDFLVSKLGVYKVKVVKRDGCYMIVWGSKKDIDKIVSYLYKDAKYYLKRKVDKLLQ